MENDPLETPGGVHIKNYENSHIDKQGLFLHFPLGEQVFDVFEILRQAGSNAIGSLAPGNPNHPQQTPKVVNTPPRAVRSYSSKPLLHFTRKDELFLIEKNLKAASGNDDDTPSCCVIWGMVGVGKSHLAHKYIHGVTCPSSIIWLQASTDKHLEYWVLRALKEIFPQVKSSEWISDGRGSRAKLKNWLELEDYEGCILVLDDVRYETISIVQDIIPTRGSTCKVLITTRSRLIADRILPSTEKGRCCEIQVLDTTRAVQMFMQISNILPNENQQRQIIDITNAVGCLPLAIETAANYAEQNGLDAAWKERNNALNWENEHSRYRDHQRYDSKRVLKNAFDFFWDLKERRPKPPEALLFDDMSFFDPNNISIRLLEGRIEASSFWALPFRHHKKQDDPIRMRETIMGLESLSLVTQRFEGKEKYLSIHKLVQELSRKQLVDLGNANKHIEEGIKWLNRALDTPDKQPQVSRNLIWYEEILRHIQSILQCIEDIHKSPKTFKSYKAKLMDTQEIVVGLLLEGGQYKKAVKAARATFNVRQNVLGLADPETLRSLNMYGKALRYEGQYQKALGAITRAGSQMKELRKRTWDRPDQFYLDFLACLDNYALLLRCRGKYKEARALCEKTLGHGEELLGPEDPLVLGIIDSLALIYQSLGMYTEAADYSREVLRRREVALGDSHIDTLASLDHYASVLYCQGFYKETESMMTRALERREQILGNEHPDTLASLQSYASVLRAQGLYNRATDYTNRAFKARRTKLGDNHPDTLTSLDHLALVYLCQAQYGKAEIKARDAFNRRQRALGLKHPDTHTSQARLASIYRCQGRYQEAEILFGKVLSWRQENLGIGHPDASSILCELASIYAAYGRYIDAECTYEQALQLQQSCPGSTHPNTLSTRSALSWVRLKLGKYEDAKNDAKLALEEQEANLGVRHPDTLTSYHNYAVILRHQGFYEDAESLIKRALYHRKEILGQQHPDTLASLDNYASILRCLGRYDEAMKNSEQALRGRQDIFSADHPDTLSSLDTYSAVLESLNKKAEAAVEIRKALKSRQALPESHPERLLSWYSYARVLHMEGRHLDALDASQEALNGRRNSLLPGHPDILSSFQQVGLILLTVGRYDEAKEEFREAFQGRKRLQGNEHSDTLTSLAYYWLTVLHESGPLAAQGLFSLELCINEIGLKTTGKKSINDITNIPRAFSRRLIETAIEKYDEIKTLREDNSDNLNITLAKTLLRHGNAQEAEKVLRHVRQHPDKRTFLGLAFLQQGNLSHAQSILCPKVPFTESEEEMNVVQEANGAKSPTGVGPPS